MPKKDKYKPIVKEFVSVSKHLDDDFTDLLLAEARYRARIPAFLEMVSELDSPPAKYGTLLGNAQLPEFIRTEWVDKGFKPDEIDRQMLDAYDENLVSAIESYEKNNGLLEGALRFKRVENKMPLNKIDLTHG